MKSGKMSSVIGSVTVGAVRLWILVGAAVVVVAVAVGTLLLALNWHFTQTAVTKALEDRFTRDVKTRSRALVGSWQGQKCQNPSATVGG